MDNELRKERIRAGIEQLENGKSPYNSGWNNFREYYGLSNKGTNILYSGGYPTMRAEMEANGFKFCEPGYTLHNWKRFYELIENL